MKQTNWPPALTKKEIEEDPDIGLDMFALPEPDLPLPAPKDPLFVEKPILNYEPPESSNARWRHNRYEHDENKLIKKKFKLSPTT